MDMLKVTLRHACKNNDCASLRTSYSVHNGLYGEMIDRQRGVAALFSLLPELVLLRRCHYNMEIPGTLFILLKEQQLSVAEPFA